LRQRTGSKNPRQDGQHVLATFVHFGWASGLTVFGSSGKIAQGRLGGLHDFRFLFATRRFAA
jgi:hypothetical protein